MPDKKLYSSSFITLTALWAFVESGLGSILHAFHLPFTGIVLGGFSVVMISLLAQSSSQVFRTLLQATLIVLATKFFANPATSPFAFVAVAFQGLLGACLYSIKKNGLLIHLLFAVLSMLESALQKLLVMTLLLGKSFWQGIDGLGKSVSAVFHVQNNNLSMQLIALYVGLFFIWGIILALWMNKIPQQLNTRADWYKTLDPLQSDSIKPQKSKKKWWLWFILALLLGCASFFLNGKNQLQEAMIYFVRTVAILLIWQLLFVQLWRKFIVKKISGISKQEAFQQVQDQLPFISGQAQVLYAHLKPKYKGLSLLREYVLGLIILSQQGGVHE